MVEKLVLTSKPAPEPVKAEVHDALDRLGAIFRLDKALRNALKDELGVRLLTGEGPDLFVYGARRRPERLIFLSPVETEKKCRVDPAAVHEECAHALRSIFHPRENPMIQEFFGALGPILALDKRLIAGGPLLDVADTMYNMQRTGGHFSGISNELAIMLKRFLPPPVLAEVEASGGDDLVANGFLGPSIAHIMPIIAAESMADTGHLSELMETYRLLILPPREMAEILAEYKKRCAQDPDWKQKYRQYRKVCGFYLKPVKTSMGPG
jgi:hypothetical protein